jgi:hypothetical protein
LKYPLSYSIIKKLKRGKGKIENGGMEGGQEAGDFQSSMFNLRCSMKRLKTLVVSFNNCPGFLPSPARQGGHPRQRGTQSAFNVQSSMFNCNAYGFINNSA